MLRLHPRFQKGMISKQSLLGLRYASLSCTGIYNVIPGRICIGTNWQHRWILFRKCTLEACTQSSRKTCGEMTSVNNNRDFERVFYLRSSKTELLFSLGHAITPTRHSCVTRYRSFILRACVRACMRAQRCVQLFRGEHDVLHGRREAMRSNGIIPRAGAGTY